MTKKVLLLMVAIMVLVSSNTLAKAPPSPPQIFIDMVGELEKFLLDQGIQVKEGEDIKDVVTFIYFNAVMRRGKGFGTLDELVKEEAKGWAKFWCWLPTMPEDKKKKARENLQKVRRALIRGGYERTLASLTAVPSLAVTSIGEALEPSHLLAKYPIVGNAAAAFGFAIGRYPCDEWLSAMDKGAFEYKDIINPDWVRLYLK